MTIAPKETATLVTAVERGPAGAPGTNALLSRVQNAGVDLPQRATLDIIGGNAQDDATSGKTRVALQAYVIQGNGITDNTSELQWWIANNAAAGGSIWLVNGLLAGKATAAAWQASALYDYASVVTHASAPNVYFRCCAINGAARRAHSGVSAPNFAGATTPGATVNETSPDGVTITWRCQLDTSIEIDPSPVQNSRRHLSINLDVALTLNHGARLEMPGGINYIGHSGAPCSLFGVPVEVTPIVTPNVPDPAHLGSNAVIQDAWRFADVSNITGASNADIGQSFTLGGELWTVIALSGAEPDGTALRMVRTTSAFATSPSTSRAWSIGSRSGTDARILYLGPCARVTGLQNVNWATCWRDQLALHGTADAKWSVDGVNVRGHWRILGSRASTTEVFIAASTALARGAQLPDTATSWVQMTTWVRKFTDRQSRLHNVSLENVEGVAICADGSQGLCANFDLDCVHAQQSTRGNATLWANEAICFDGAFQLYLRRVATSTSPNGFPCGVRFTTSDQRDQQATGLVRFERLFMAGHYLGEDPQTTQPIGIVDVRHAVLESALGQGLLAVDMSWGSSTATYVEQVCTADSSPTAGPYIVYSPYAVAPGTIGRLKISGGAFTESPAARAPDGVFVDLDLDQDNIATYTSGWGVGQLLDDYVKRRGFVDALQVSTAMHLGPESCPRQPEAVFDDPFDAVAPWQSLSGAAVISGPYRGPRGDRNAARVHSAAGVAIKTIYSGGGGYYLARGDRCLVGLFARAFDRTKPIPLTACTLSLNVGGTPSEWNGSGSANLTVTDSPSQRIGGGWRFLAKLGRITTVGTNPVARLLQIGTDTTTDVLVDSPFLIWIPAGSEYASAWQANQSYATATTVVPTAGVGDFVFRKMMNGGTSGVIEPNWASATQEGDQIIDGTITWTAIDDVLDDQVSLWYRHLRNFGPPVPAGSVALRKLQRLYWHRDAYLSRTAGGGIGVGAVEQLWQPQADNPVYTTGASDVLLDGNLKTAIAYKLDDNTATRIHAVVQMRSGANAGTWMLTLAWNRDAGGLPVAMGGLQSTSGGTDGGAVPAGWSATLTTDGGDNAIVQVQAAANVKYAVVLQAFKRT